MKKKNTKTYIGIVIVAILALLLANPKWLPLSQELKEAVAQTEKSNLLFQSDAHTTAAQLIPLVLAIALVWLAYQIVKLILGARVSAIEEGNRNVSEGAAVVASTGEAFREIEQQVNLLDNHIKESLRHIQVVEDTSKHILGSMTDLQNQSKKFEQESENISAATEQQSATMHEVTDSSHQLTSMAQNMQDEVKKFKV